MLKGTEAKTTSLIRGTGGSFVCVCVCVGGGGGGGGGGGK